MTGIVSDFTLADLTTGALDGTGVFDKLMLAAKVHLEQEYDKGAIRGPEYSTVYLGQLESSMQTALAFVMGRQKANLEAQLLSKQILLAEQELLTAQVQRTLVEAQVAKVNAEIELTQLQKQNLGAEKLLIEANTAKVTAETLNVPKQGALLDAQTAIAVQQKANAIIEGTVLVAQECKLRAEYDYTVQNTLKSAAEITLLAQRTATEKAQILGLGVDDDSMIGKQKKLYEAQTTGFKRDAEQKAAGLYVDVWKTLRMTDDAWQANQTQGLDDVTMGKVMALLRQGVGVPPPPP